MRTSPVVWDSVLIEQLRSLWAEGKSASQIAETLGPRFTRNSIIGKAHRLKLEKRRKPPVPRSNLVYATPHRAKRVTLPALPINRPDIVRARPADEAAWKPLPGFPPPKPLAALGDIGRVDRVGDCRWPLGENPTLFCGCATHAIYCPVHTQMSRANGAAP